MARHTDPKTHMRYVMQSLAMGTVPAAALPHLLPRATFRRMADAAPPIAIPRLSTERLLLREPRASDFDTFARFYAELEMTRFLSGVLDRRTAWRLFASGAGAWMLTGAGAWAVELRDTGEYIGTVGAFFRADVAAIGPDSDLELGWVLFPPFWNKRYATEAARAALAYGLERHAVPRVIAHMSPENAGSIAVAKALGMSLDGEVDLYGERSLRYAIGRVRE